MIVEKENEIKAFVPKESRKLHAQLTHPDDPVSIELTSTNGKKRSGATSADVTAVINDLGISSSPKSTTDKKTGHQRLTWNVSPSFLLDDITTRAGKRKPPTPLTTSSLQQEASRRFGRSVANVMRTAQKLYEAGYITYMRTDSTNLSNQSLTEMGSYITSEYGKKYHNRTVYGKKNKNAQEAHEAIRPTKIDRTAAGTTEQQVKLYQLIWSRTLASQMAHAEYDTTTYTFVPHDVTNAASQKRTTKGVVQTFD